MDNLWWLRKDMPCSDFQWSKAKIYSAVWDSRLFFTHQSSITLIFLKWKMAGSKLRWGHQEQPTYGAGKLSAESSKLLQTRNGISARCSPEQPWEGNSGPKSSVMVRSGKSMLPASRRKRSTYKYRVDKTSPLPLAQLPLSRASLQSADQPVRRKVLPCARIPCSKWNSIRLFFIQGSCNVELKMFISHI